MKTGYARCSTNESKQDIERQVRELKQAGAERVFLEYEHGDAVIKEQLSLLLEQAQPGDTIITLEVSRLARSTKQLCEIIEAIGQKRLCLVIVGSITMDCRNGHADPMTEAFLQMAGVFSQLELSMIRARVRSGMANARAKGAKIGRPELTADDILVRFRTLSSHQGSCFHHLRIYGTVESKRIICVLNCFQCVFLRGWSQ